MQDEVEGATVLLLAVLAGSPLRAACTLLMVAASAPKAESKERIDCTWVEVSDAANDTDGTIKIRVARTRAVFFIAIFISSCNAPAESLYTENPPQR
jgi:hypothetical protein